MVRKMKSSGIDWIGDIPNDWEVVNYRRIFNRRKEYDDNPNKQVLSLTITGVKEKNEDFGKMAEDFTGHQIVKKGDLVFTPRDFDATPILSGIAPCDGCISNLYFVLYGKTDEIHLSFYNYFMWGVKWGGDIWKKLSYGMRFSYNFNQFSDLPTVLISLDEQKKIVNYLDSTISKVDNIIEKQQQEIELLKELRKSIISHSVTKGLNPRAKMKPSGIDWIGDIPKDWALLKLKKITHSRAGGAWGEENEDDAGGTICIRVADFDYDHLTLKKGIKYTRRTYENETVQKLQLDKGDLLIEKSGGGEQTPVGRTVIYDWNNDTAVFSNFIERIRLKPGYSSKFVNYMFSALYNTIIQKFVKQTTGIQNLDLSGLFFNEIPIPSTIDEQTAVANYLDVKTAEIDSAISAKAAIIEKLIEYKKSLIYEVVTGKKEVE